MAPDISFPATDLAIQKLSALCDLLGSIPTRSSTRELHGTVDLVRARQYSHLPLAKVRLPPKYEAASKYVDVIRTSNASGSQRDSTQESKPLPVSHSPLKLTPRFPETALTSPIKLAPSILKTASTASQSTLMAESHTAPATPQDISVSKRVASVPWIDRSISMSYSAGLEPDMQAIDRMKIHLVKEKLNLACQASGLQSGVANTSVLNNAERASVTVGRIPTSGEMAGNDRLYEWMLDEDEQPLMLTRWISAGIQGQSPIKMRAPSGSLAKRRFASGVHRELEKLGISTSFGSR